MTHLRPYPPAIGAASFPPPPAGEGFDYGAGEKTLPRKRGRVGVGTSTRIGTRRRRR
jgi:hypothetical protein